MIIKNVIDFNYTYIHIYACLLVIIKLEGNKWYDDVIIKWELLLTMWINISHIYDSVKYLNKDHMKRT